MRAYRVAYDGRDYHGFQRQPDVPTVEDELLAALDRLDVLGEGEETPDGYAAAGRTDAGVSALAQTVAFDAPDWLSPAAFGGELPPDVRVWASADVPDGFHATHDATAREYVYHWHAPDADDDVVADVLDRMAGEHDFRDLTPDDRGTVRDLETDVERDGPFLALRFRADGFPRHLVRRLVALVAAVAGDEVPLSTVDRVLSPDPLPDHEAPGTAPPEPLVLSAVEYGGAGDGDRTVAFAVDPDAAESARRVFEERRVERATAARVARGIRDGVGGDG